MFAICHYSSQDSAFSVFNIPPSSNYSPTKQPEICLGLICLQIYRDELVSMWLKTPPRFTNICWKPVLNISSLSKIMNQIFRFSGLSWAAIGSDCQEIFCDVGMQWDRVLRGDGILLCRVRCTIRIRRCSCTPWTTTKGHLTNSLKNILSLFQRHVKNTIISNDYIAGNGSF